MLGTSWECHKEREFALRLWVISYWCWTLEAECRNFYFWHSQSLLSGTLFVSGSNLYFDKNFKLLSILEKKFKLKF